MLNLKKLKEKNKLYILAKAAKIPLSTAYSWKDHIPSWRETALLSAAETLGIDISDCIIEEAT